MELFKILGTVAVDGMDSTEKGLERLGNVATKAGKAIAAGVAAGAVAVGALTKAAVQAYADYEQLVGGVETLFGTRGAKTVEEYAALVGKSVDQVSAEFEMLQTAQTTALDNAAKAYQTAGMSANEYMETISGFAASLKQSTASELEAAEVADMAVQDMADNANKMGTSMASIQNAYQGFAKQNYTMLDNLKLGYGGTKEEMGRLLEEAEKLSGIEYDISSLSDVYEAIHVIQEEMGITGTTAKEASKTISGSLSAARSAWKNLLTGVADDNADFEGLIDDFVETVGVAAENIIPRVEIALVGAAKLIDELVPVIVDKIPAIINDSLPKIVQAAVSIVENLVRGIRENQEEIMNTTAEVVMLLIQTITDMLPQIIELGLELLLSIINGIVENLDQLASSALEIIYALADGIVEYLPELTTAIIEIINKIVVTLTDEETLSQLLDATLKIILAIADGIVKFLPQLVTAAITIVDKLIEFLLEEENLNKLIEATITLVTTLADGLIENVGLLMDGGAELAAKLVEKILETDWYQVGWDIVSGIGDGMASAWNRFVNEHEWASGLMKFLFPTLALSDDAKNTAWKVLFPSLAINSPLPSHAEGLDYVPYDGYVAELHKGEMVVPAAESQILRSGGFGRMDADIIQLLERILLALQDMDNQNVSLSINNREFARMVKAVG